MLKLLQRTNSTSFMYVSLSLDMLTPLRLLLHATCRMEISVNVRCATTFICHRCHNRNFRPSIIISFGLASPPGVTVFDLSNRKLVYLTSTTTASSFRNPATPLSARVPQLGTTRVYVEVLTGTCSLESLITALRTVPRRRAFGAPR